MTVGKGGLLNVYYISAGQDAGQNVPDFPFPIRPQSRVLFKSLSSPGSFTASTSSVRPHPRGISGKD